MRSRRVGLLYLNRRRLCLCVQTMELKCERLMERPDGNYWNNSFVLQMAQLRWFLRVFRMKRLEGFYNIRFMCAALRRICFSLCLFGVRRDGWRVITGLKSLLRWPELRVQVVFWYAWHRRGLQKAHIGLWRLWLGTVQLGGRFWMEMSHCSSLWSVAMSSKAKTLHHLCTRD